MTDQTTSPADDEIIEHARAVGLVEPAKAPAFLAAFKAEQERRATETTYQGPECVPVEDDSPTGQKYPCGLGVYCDSCGTEFRGDFIVTDTMTKPERLEVVRTHVRTTLRWQCDAGGDFCESCAERRRAAAEHPCTDLRHTGPIRAQLGCNGPDPAETHQGPHPEHGGLETHVGTRDTCSGPDCGPIEPDFYQAGHTYAAAENPLYAWRFRCDTVTTHPEDGERTALGWRYFNGQWDAIAYGEGDWELTQTRGVEIQTDTPR